VVTAVQLLQDMAAAAAAASVGRRDVGVHWDRELALRARKIHASSWS
jgi:hypothetical protein